MRNKMKFASTVGRELAQRVRNEVSVLQDTHFVHVTIRRVETLKFFIALVSDLIHVEAAGMVDPETRRIMEGVSNELGNLIEDNEWTSFLEAEEGQDGHLRIKYLSSETGNISTKHFVLDKKFVETLRDKCAVHFGKEFAKGVA